MENENKNYKEIAEFLKTNNQNSNLNENPDFFLGLLKKVQVTSAAVRKVKIVEDHKYFLSQDKNYEVLLNKTSKKIENLILKMMIFGNKVANKDQLPNIRKK
jgi:hypothetical protein